MKIMVNKEHLDDLHSCIERNVEFMSTVITMYVTNDKVATAIEGKLREIVYYLNQTYNPELVRLKQQARSYYQKWLNLKKKDPTTANAVYLEYMKLKQRIDELEIPF